MVKRPELGRPSMAADAPAWLRTDGHGAAAAYRADGGDGPSWSLRAASVAGPSHRLAGRANEDAYAWAQAGGALAVAVADGVGATTGSAAASAAAVSAATAVVAAVLEEMQEEEAEEPLGEDLGVDAVGAANQAVAAVGGATTLVLAVLDAAGRGWAARVGDSTALVLVAGEWRELWPGPADDGAVATATAALPSADPVVETAEVTVPEGGVLVLATDGLADPLRDGPTTVAPALAEALAEPPAPLSLALVADFSRQGCLDDRTLLAVWPRGERPMDQAG